MAKGRMLSKSLSTSEKFKALGDVAGELVEFCHALYPLLIPHTDDFGRLQGDPYTVKCVCYPASSRSLEDFAAGLLALHTVELIGWYAITGKRFIQIADFDAHQSGLHKRTCSQFPELPGNSRKVPEVPGNSGLREEKRREEKRTEGKRTEQEQIHVRAATAIAHSLALKVQTSELRVRFEEFWAHWPKHRRIAKAKALKAWEVQNPSVTLTGIILTAVDAQKQSQQWLRDGGQFIPYPATWLHQQRWDDEIRAGPILSDRTIRMAHASKEFLES